MYILDNQGVETQHTAAHSGTVRVFIDSLLCASTPWWNNLPARWGSTTLCNIVRTFLDEQFPARWIGRGSPYITWPVRSPGLTPPDFSFGGLLRTRSTWHQYVICHTYKKEFMLLSTMSHHRWFITHGSRLFIGWTFPVPLMEAMLRFMEHKVTNPSIHSLQ